MHKILPLDSPLILSSRRHAPELGSGALRRAAVLCVAMLALGLVQAVGAAPGDLDPSFDADGRVLTHFGAIDGDAPGRSDFARVVAVQPDGKLVVAGGSDVAAFGSSDVALARYNTDGRLDASFGSGGRVLTDFGADDIVATLAIQPGGKIVLAVPGISAGIVSPTLVISLGRYNPDGTLDQSFGSGGRLLIDTSNALTGFDRDPGIMLQPDGKLVVVGSRAEPLPDNEFGQSDFVVAQFNTDGSLDGSFGSGGQVLTDFTEDPNDPDPRNDIAQKVIRQPDGKLVVAGRSDRGFFRDLALAFARYNPDGSPDLSFGSGGRVLIDFGGLFDIDTGFLTIFIFEINELVVQPDGRLVGGFTFLDSGASPAGSPSFFLTRLNTDGSVDASFGSGGLVAASQSGGGFFFGGGVIAQADGKLVLAAGSEAFPGSDSLLTLVRYNPDGSLDSSFGSGGRVRTSFDGRLLSSFADASSLVVQPDGKLVAVGTSDAGGDPDFALARYLVTDERPAPPPKCGGRRATMLGTPGNDTLRGTLFGRDVILGLGGNDTIRGLGGEDIICGGQGNDMLIGGDESDRLLGGAGNDRLFGDLGLSAVDGDDALFGGPGRDTLVGDHGNDLLAGEAGNDRLFGDQGADILDGGVGRDRCKDRFGQNTFNGCDIGSGRSPPEPPRDPIPIPCAVGNTPGCNAQ